MPFYFIRMIMFEWLRYWAFAMMKIKKIVESEKDEMETMMESLHEARWQLHKMMDTDKPNEAAIMKQIDKIGAISTDRLDRAFEPSGEADQVPLSTVRGWVGVGFRLV